MAGMERHLHTRNLAIGKGQGLLMSPTQGQADIIGATLAPAISKHPRAFLYGWLPLSDAYRHPLCKQPNYIFSLVTAPCLLPLASSLLTAQRHPLCQLPLSDASGILFANDLTAFFPLQTAICLSASSLLGLNKKREGTSAMEALSLYAVIFMQ